MTDARPPLPPPQPIGHVDDTPSRRVSVDVLRSPRRSLVRVTIERDGPDGWRPDRWWTRCSAWAENGPDAASQPPQGRGE